MEDHHNLTGYPSTSGPPQFHFAQPGPSTSNSGPVYGTKQNNNHNGLEDIPDVEAYERSLQGEGSGFHFSSMGNMPHELNKPVRTRENHHQRDTINQLPFNSRLKLITPKVEVIEDLNTPMMSPVSTSTKILQRSGIKMEIPPYLDPDSHDDDPEEGVTYPDPDLFDIKNTNMTEYDLDVMKLGKQAVDDIRKKIEVPDASAPPNKIVEYLMYHRTLKESELLQLNAYRTKRNRLSLNLVKNNIDREFDQKACESLVKKLKDKKHDLQNLIDVVLTKGKKYTGCITIPRTLDGRLQVHGRKGFPHVVYGKLWRFSEMTKNETRHVDHCKHAFEMKSDMVSDVCVNPYHYEIVIGTMIVGQRDGHDGRDIPSTHPSAQRFQTPNPMVRHPSLDDRFIPPMQMRPQNMPPMMSNLPPPQMSPMVPMAPSNMPPPRTPHHVSPSFVHPHSHHSYPSTSAHVNMNPHVSQMSSMTPSPHPMHQHVPPHMGYPPHEGPSCSYHYQHPHPHYSDYNPHYHHYPEMYGHPQEVYNLHYYNYHHPTPLQQIPFRPTVEHTREVSVTLSTFRKFCKQVFGDRFFEGDSEEFVELRPSGHEFDEEEDPRLCGVRLIKRRVTDGDTLQGPMPADAPYHDLCKFILTLTSETLTMNGDEPEMIEGNEKWGTIVYYEHTTAVGEKKCVRGNFHVDGGFIMSENRYSLGLEPNPIRTASAFKVRRAIIDGVRFSYKKDGSVWVQNYMKFPIFVTSGYLDEQSGGLKSDKVHKLYGSAKLKVFGFDIAKRIIRDSLFSKHMATMYLQGKHTPMNEIYRRKDPVEIRREATRTTDSLAKYCCVRVSFCKGFGEAYPNRRYITECPVWVELKINSAYDYMDAILTDLDNRSEPMGIEDFAKLGINVSDD